MTTLRTQPKEIIAKILMGLSYQEVQAFCETSKEIDKKCNETFWRNYAKAKLHIKTKGSFKTWRQLMRFLKDKPPVITQTLNLKILSYFCDVFDSSVVIVALNAFWDEKGSKLNLFSDTIAEKYKYGKNSIQKVVKGIIQSTSKHVSSGFENMMDDVAEEEGINRKTVEKFDKVKFDKKIKPKNLDYVLRIRYDYCSDTFLMIWIFTYDETDPFELLYKVKVDREGKVVYVENIDGYPDTWIAVYKGVKSYYKHWEIYGSEDEMWGG